MMKYKTNKLGRFCILLVLILIIISSGYAKGKKKENGNRKKSENLIPNGGFDEWEWIPFPYNLLNSLKKTKSDVK